MNIACLRGSIGVIGVFLRNIAVDLLNDCSHYPSGWTPVHCACIGNNTEILALLIAFGCLTNLPSLYGSTPLHICAKRNRVECAKLLLPHYSVEDLCCVDSYGQAANGSAEVELLMKARLKELHTSEAEMKALIRAQQQSQKMILSKYPRVKKRKGKKAKGRSDDSTDWRKE